MKNIQKGGFMKKSGFTLAEILISLMILGVIASLTIPSLIQNTQKKEQVVQIKKGLSMINQAITMNYALTGDDFSSENLNDATEITNMLKNRLSVVDFADGQYVTTQDGLSYYVDVTDKGAKCGETDQEVVSGNNKAAGTCLAIIISTKPASASNVKTYAAAKAKLASELGNGTNILTGYYKFYAGADRVVPTSDVQKVMNATDASGQTTSGT